MIVNELTTHLYEKGSHLSKPDIIYNETKP